MSRGYGSKRTGYGSKLVFWPFLWYTLCRNFHEGDVTHENAHGPGRISALLPRTAFHCSDPGSPRPFASFSASTPCSGTKRERVRLLSQPKNGRGDPV